MPVSVARSLVIIAAVAGTIFFTRLCPFLFFRKPIPPVPGIAAGSHRNVGDLLFKGGKYHILSIWITGVYSGGSIMFSSTIHRRKNLLLRMNLVPSLIWMILHTLTF